MYSKDIAQKQFFVGTGRTYVRPYGHTDKGDAICPPPPIINGGGIKNNFQLRTLIWRPDKALLLFQRCIIIGLYYLSLKPVNNRNVLLQLDIL